MRGLGKDFHDEQASFYTFELNCLTQRDCVGVSLEFKRKEKIPIAHIWLHIAPVSSSKSSERIAQLISWINPVTFLYA